MLVALLADHICVVSIPASHVCWLSLKMDYFMTSQAADFCNVNSDAVWTILQHLLMSLAKQLLGSLQRRLLSLAFGLMTKQT